ncbi:MAG: hypothetical protein GX316_10020 [Firmicutes bacterium]|nr:hypothetical protein [Bacillota bacterium]
MLRRYRIILFIVVLVSAALLNGCALLTSTAPPKTQEPGPSDPPKPPALSSLRGIIKLQGTEQVARPISVSVGDHKLTTTDGRFSLPELETGTYSVHVFTDHFLPHTEEIAVTSEPTALEVTLQPKYTENELNLFARLVYAEAAGEPEIGQIAVAASVLNRVLSPDYPNTLEGVIREVTVVNGVGYYQYSPLLDGRINEIDRLDANRRQQAYADCMKVIFAALSGQDPSRGATGFFNPDKVAMDSWVRDQPPSVKIGNHQFFL